jgi:hypothetical protein
MENTKPKITEWWKNNNPKLLLCKFLTYIMNIYSAQYCKVENTEPKSLGLVKLFNFRFNLLNLAVSMCLVTLSLSQHTVGGRVLPSILLKSRSKSRVPLSATWEINERRVPLLHTDLHAARLIPFLVITCEVKSILHMEKFRGCSRGWWSEIENLEIRNTEQALAMSWERGFGLI